MSQFQEKMLALCKELDGHKDHVAANEQATKEHLIGPFFAELGWKRDPKTWRAEYDADFNGKKKGEKVDYAILQGTEPVILIECKAYTARERALSARDGQLARYFAATSAKISVITNGIVYRFFTDLDKDNIQDAEPFFVFDCAAPSKADLAALEMFTPGQFDIRAIREWASEHQFVAKVRAFLVSVVAKPAEAPGFALYLLEHTYSGQRSKAVVQRLNNHLPDLMNEVLGEEIRSRFASGGSAATPSALDERGVVTTDEERAALAAIKAVLAGAGKDPGEVTHRDMKHWMNVSYRRPGNWFVRLCFNDGAKALLFRVPVSEIAGLLPEGFQAQPKGKNTSVVLDVQQLARLARAIIYCFEARAAVRDGAGDDDESDENALPSVA